MLEHRIDGAVDAKRRLDYVWNHVFTANLLDHSLILNHIMRNQDLFTIDRDTDLISQQVIFFQVFECGKNLASFIFIERTDPAHVRRYHDLFYLLWRVVLQNDREIVLGMICM